MNINENTFDAIIVGAGHAGCESALALARLKNKTILFCLNLDSIALLACNPSIGGTAKGHLVCEIDALGGEMGKNTDKTLIQIRMLNRGKGPAVYSLRAQSDKIDYHTEMKRTLEQQENLQVRQAEVSEILIENNKIIGVKTAQGETYLAKTVVVATGVYLKSKIITGEWSKESGPNGFSAATYLSQSILNLGHSIKRLKTGTPARVDGRTINYKETILQEGEENLQTFSFLTKEKPKNKAVCYLTYTTEKTIKVIKENIHRAPLFSGLIKGVGPRYCPSIEDKIMRFADKERHQVFLEPESLSTNEIYVQGMSTSMPIDVQKQIYHSIIGLENVRIMRDAYAIEYDAIDATELKPTLESKKVEGLFFAGQVNGTSGYEEAAAQGIIAGINADCFLKQKEALILKRSDAYIGVLIDDIVTKETSEPYRMMTSRAEYRLILRQDNADIRLTEIGRKFNLVDDGRYFVFNEKKELIKQAEEKLKIRLKLDEKLTNFFRNKNENIPSKNLTVKEAIKRNNITAFDINEVYGLFEGLPASVIEYINTEVKYEGYIKQQYEEVERSKSQSDLKIPQDFDFNSLKGITKEARQKLSKIRPQTIGQASRISGVSPADISILIVFVKAKKSK